MTKVKNIYWIKYTKRIEAKKISWKIWTSLSPINEQSYTYKKKEKIEKYNRGKTSKQTIGIFKM